MTRLQEVPEHMPPGQPNDKPPLPGHEPIREPPRPDSPPPIPPQEPPPGLTGSSRSMAGR
ncbi:MAG TPA: hypothetical protein VIV54_05790 [Burkholderiales bacterium]